ERDAACFAGLLIDRHFAGDSVGSERQVAGVHRGQDQPGGRIKRRVNVATSGSAIARPASETAAPILVVLEPVGRYAGAVRRQHAIHLLQTLTQFVLGIRKLDWALKDAIRQMREILFYSRDAQIQID